METHDGRCPKCGSETILVTAPLVWGVDEDNPKNDEDGAVEVYDEVSGHFCPKCRRLRSLSLNTEHERNP